MLLLEDFKPQKWHLYLSDCIKSLNKLDEILKPYFTDSSTMSVNDIAELRKTIDKKNYLISASMQPLHMCIPHWESEVDKAKDETIKNLMKEGKGITAAKESYKANQPYLKKNKDLEIMKTCLKMCRTTMDKASKISFSLAYQTRGLFYFDTSKEDENDNEFRK